VCGFVRPGGGLARYMQCMDKLRRAVQYLTINNPDSSQLSHVVSYPLFRGLVWDIHLCHDVPVPHLWCALCCTEVKQNLMFLYVFLYWFIAKGLLKTAQNVSCTASSKNVSNVQLTTMDDQIVWHSCIYSSPAVVLNDKNSFYNYIMCSFVVFRVWWVFE